MSLVDCDIRILFRGKSLKIIGTRYRRKRRHVIATRTRLSRDETKSRNHDRSSARYRDVFHRVAPMCSKLSSSNGASAFRFGGTCRATQQAAAAVASPLEIQVGAHQSPPSSRTYDPPPLFRTANPFSTPRAPRSPPTPLSSGKPGLLSSEATRKRVSGAAR